jgi:hypothetical protein
MRAGWITKILWATFSFIIRKMVGATDTIVFATVTLIPAVVLMVCVTLTLLSIPEIKAFASEKIFSAWKTIFRIIGKST